MSNLKKRGRTRTTTADFDSFVSEAGGGDEPQVGWEARAASDKKTEAQAFRYNRAQKALLDHAKRVEGRDYSKILAELVWKPLEEKYGHEVPIPPRS